MERDLSNENIIHVKKDGIEYLQFRKLLEFEDLVNCFTLKTGNLNFRRKTSEELALQSIQKICNVLDVNPNTIVRPNQKHTDCVEKVDSASEDLGMREIDGLITNKKDINLLLTFADCTPIILYDPVNKAIGNIHSGWRGTVQKIGKKATLKMMKEYGSKPEDIIACFGPAIGQCHFEVEEEVKNIFENEFGKFTKKYEIIKKQSILKDGVQKYNINTNLINRLELEELGLLPKNIIESGICTVCNSDLIHSYRANKEKFGLNATIIGRQERKEI